MIRQIKGLSFKLAHDLCAQCPHVGIIEEHIDDELVSIILDDSVIMKIYDNQVFLDVGGKKASLNEKEFIAIEAR